MHKIKKHQAPTKIGIRTLRSHLSEYVKRAHDGQVIQVTSRDEVVAELHPAFADTRAVRRKPGALKGKIRVAPDFNELPEEVLAAFEN